MLSLRPIAEIHLKNLINNFNYIDSYIGDSKIMAVVKANAYGHGLLAVSKALEKAGVYGLCVAIAEELIILRQSNINIPILHLGIVENGNLGIYESEKNICTINSIDDNLMIKTFVDGSNKKIHCHLKFDTGMGRLGIRYDKAEDVINLIKNIKGIYLGGIYSHFSSADEKNNQFMKLQLNRFKDITKLADDLIPEKRDYHISNSAGLFKSTSNYFNVVRAGISLYGVNIINEKHNLKPVMKLKAPLVLVKDILKGESVGYNRQFIAKNNIKAGYIQIGYADGYPLSMVNTKTILYNKNLLNVIGKVSMDITAIDCTSVDIKKGDWVTLFGEELNRIEDIYPQSDKSIYSMLTGISERVLRKYLNE